MIQVLIKLFSPQKQMEKITIKLHFIMDKIRHTDLVNNSMKFMPEN